MHQRIVISVFKLSGVALSIATAFPLLAAARSTPDTDSSPGTELETIQVSGGWLGSGLQNSLQKFSGSRTVVSRSAIQDSGAASIEDVMRRIPGVQVTDNSSSGGSSMSLNIGVRGLDGRFSPRSTVLLDGIPLAVAPYGQPQLSFAPVSLNNIESVDVVRGGGAVRYGPQNVGGIINFNTRPIPAEPLAGDAAVRYNSYGEGGSNKQYSAFLGGQLPSGLGMALLYSGTDGSSWRQHSAEQINDFSLKMRYQLSNRAEIVGKIGYYEARAEVPGGLNQGQYAANPFQSQRTRDYWQGRRTSMDLGYLNTISSSQEIEVKTYYNSSFRASGLANNVDRAATKINSQPRNYDVFGIAPRYTQRMVAGDWRHDVTLGYRYLREDSSEISVDSALTGKAAQDIKRSSDNNSDAHSFYIDDQMSWKRWRITPGLRFEHVNLSRHNKLNGFTDAVSYDQPLPALGISFLATPALTLFGNYNTSFGSVQFLQLNLQNYGNQLQAEIAKTAELGARWKKDGLKWDATLFDLRFNNQIEYVNPYYLNRGKTHHRGIETSVEYAFDQIPALAGLSAYATYAYTLATLQSAESGARTGNDLPFYSRNVDSQGLRYTRNSWTINLSTTHQSGQYADNANTVAESADGAKGWMPGYRLWNAQIGWKLPSKPSMEIDLGVNNLTDKRYFTRNTDTNAGKLAGAPRMVYVQMRAGF